MPPGMNMSLGQLIHGGYFTLDLPDTMTPEAILCDNLPLQLQCGCGFFHFAEKPMGFAIWDTGASGNTLGAREWKEIKDSMMVIFGEDLSRKAAQRQSTTVASGAKIYAECKIYVPKWFRNSGGDPVRLTWSAFLLQE